MKKRIAALLMAFVLWSVFMPAVNVYAATEETVTIEDEEIPLNDMPSEDGVSIAVILASVSGVMTIGAAFIWLKLEKKNVVEEEE